MQDPPRSRFQTTCEQILSTFRIASADREGYQRYDSFKSYDIERQLSLQLCAVPPDVSDAVSVSDLLLQVKFGTGPFPQRPEAYVELLCSICRKIAGGSAVNIMGDVRTFQIDHGWEHIGIYRVRVSAT